MQTYILQVLVEESMIKKRMINKEALRTPEWNIDHCEVIRVSFAELNEHIQ